MKTLLKRIAMGYVVIMICIIMSYIPIYSIPVLLATSLSTGSIMVLGTGYTLIVEKPIGKVMGELLYPDKKRYAQFKKAGFPGVMS